MSLKSELRLMVGTSRINPIRFFSYLGFASVVVLILMGLGTLFFKALFFNDIETATSLTFKFHTVVLQSAYIIVSLWWLSRRLHDFNGSGRWVLVPLISLALLMMIIMFQLPTPQIVNVALFYVGMGSFAFLMILGIFPGKAGKDDYGPRPPINTIYNYIFFIIFLVSFFGYLIWRLIAIFGQSMTMQ